MDAPLVSRHSPVPPSRVWQVLADGWSYSSWVVGTSRIRAVEPGWPAAGRKIYHSAGPWPLVIDDETEVLECDLEHRLRMQARGWPFGEATIEVTLTAQDGGTLIELREDVTVGPSQAVPQGLRQLGIVPRNKESLLRLSLLAERSSEPAAAR